VQTTIVLTANWADPAKQVTAINTMAGSGIDVVTYQQDSTRALVEAAERKKMYVCGYHEDASPSAPNGWLTGAVWNWGPVYAELVGEIIKGTYRPCVMFAGLEAGWVKVAHFGKSVPADVRKRVLDTVEGLRSGKIKPFTGPIKDQTGVVKIKDGVVPTSAQLQTIDWLMQGVIGSTK
jgi:basic membrane lipoprotein Med (substrate-binding protein (PBP1-ABC) superfamily)